MKRHNILLKECYRGISSSIIKAYHMRIFLDDLRVAPQFGIYGDPITWDKVVRTAEELIELIDKNAVTYISFDHDLGTELTGYDVAKHIEELAAKGLLNPIDYSIHSANPVGAANIDAAMKNAWKFWDLSLRQDNNVKNKK